MWSQSDLARISLGPYLTLSWGEHEEGVRLSEPVLMDSWIRDNKQVILRGVSHFAPLQDPGQFAAAVDTFLA